MTKVQSITAWIGAASAAIVLVVALLWGVPYYIRAKVAEQVKVITAQASKPQSITDLEAADLVIIARLDAIDAGQLRIETKVDTFSASFMAYLQRQAEQ